MNIRIAKIEDAPDLVEFNQAMALETEGKRLETNILRSGVEAIFNDEKKGFYVVAEESKIIGGLMVTFEWSDWRNSWVLVDSKRLYFAGISRKKNLQSAL